MPGPHSSTTHTSRPSQPQQNWREILRLITEAAHSGALRYDISPADLRHFFHQIKEEIKELRQRIAVEFKDRIVAGA
ncbi:hypothetical protein FRC03_004547 [Tulasnella sp. 419]|nr:hypothetical protein FRC03_004547 [Tulasnella sp. 419]